MSAIDGPLGATNGIGLFTGAQVAAIRAYCGYGSYASFGYVLAGPMATLDTQMAGMVAAEAAQVTSLLVLLPTLDIALQTASQNLDTAQASVWTHNANEIADRTKLFRMYRLRLCDLFNVPPGPGLADGGNKAVRC